MQRPEGLAQGLSIDGDQLIAKVACFVLLVSICHSGQEKKCQTWLATTLGETATVAVTAFQISFETRVEKCTEVNGRPRFTLKVCSFNH